MPNTLTMLRTAVKRMYDRLTGLEDQNWSRVVVRRAMREWIAELEPQRLRVLEISGEYWRRTPFAAYTSVRYPTYDLCAEPLNERFDLIIADQVFEHLLWPYRAGKNAHTMLDPGGHLLIATPFLVRIHNEPTDCSRWTETGLRHFLAECGFPIEQIRTGSWGNRAIVRAHLKPEGWVRYRRRLHPLYNEPTFPYHVWAIARK